MTTIFIDYPTEFSWKTKKTFSNNAERTEYVRQVLKRKKVESPCHDYDDYVVEFTKSIKPKYEYWILGS
jgi:hypothetical protein